MSSLTRRDSQTARRSTASAALAAAIGFLAIAAFEAALALGAPLGQAAWGGASADLPIGFRVASGVAVAVWTLAAVIVLGRAGFHVRLPQNFVRWATWALVAISVLAALMNFASSSPWERFIWGPVALIEAGLCMVVARAGTVASSR